MLGWPNLSAYDPWWTSSGFCVVDDAKVPTELLCYFSLTSSAIGAFFLSKHNYKQLNEINPLLGERIQSSVFANAAHGFGHIFLWLLDEPAPPLQLSFNLADIANVLMLMAFWVGTLRSVVGLPTINHATTAAIAVLVSQYLLRVPPELNFTYSQSVILLGGCLDQLRRRGDYLKDGYAGSFLFLATSLHNLPLLVMYSLEMFSCSKSFLSGLGGHAVYDLYVSLFPFGLYFAVVKAGEARTSGKTKGD